MLTLRCMPCVAFEGRFADPPVHITLNSFCPYITEHFAREGVRNPDPLVVLEEETLIRGFRDRVRDGVYCNAGCFVPQYACQIMAVRGI